MDPSERLPELPAVVHLSTGRSLRGGERQLAWLHAGLIERGVASLVVCRAGSELPGRLSGRVSEVTWRGLWDLGGLRAFERACRSFPGAILHCHDSHAFSIGTIVGMRTGAPVVYTRRVAFAIRNSWLNRTRYARCRHIIAVSRTVAGQCQRIAPHTPVSVVHDGVRLDDEPADRSDVRRRLGIPDEALVLGSVGHFTGEKNADLIARLAERLSTEHPEVRVVIVGPVGASDAGRFARLANVVPTGRVPDATGYYPSFDAYLSAAVREGLGSAVIDAAVRDIPVVALDSGGIRDIFPESDGVVRGERAFFDAVERVVTHYESAKVHARAHGAWARNEFGLDRMIEGTIEVYATVAAGNASKVHDAP